MVGEDAGEVGGEGRPLRGSPGRVQRNSSWSWVWGLPIPGMGLKIRPCITGMYSHFPTWELQILLLRKPQEIENFWEQELIDC